MRRNMKLILRNTVQSIIIIMFSRIGTGSKHNIAHGPSQLTLDSMGIGEDINKQMFIKTVHYKGNIVAMKDVRCSALI